MGKMPSCLARYPKLSAHVLIPLFSLGFCSAGVPDSGTSVDFPAERFLAAIRVLPSTRYMDC